jgi:putative transposase
MAGAERMTIEEVVRRVLREEHGDVIRESVRLVAQELMEAEVSELIGAQHGERTEDRATHRNGYRPRRWDTRAGEIELQIPKIRQGSYFPSFLQPRKRSEQALVSVVQQAYVCGVSTRRVDQLVESLGLRIGKSEVSRIAGLLDEQVTAFRERPLEGRYPYLFVDAKVEKVRDGGRVARKCVVIAHAVHETGRREIIGLDVGAAETEAFWREFLRSLVARGLVGVELAISDAHPGMKAALAQVLGAPWQRCTVHFLRDLRGHVRRDQHDALGAVIRQIFTASDSDEARRRLRDAVEQLERRLPKVAALLDDAEADVLAFYAFPAEHWPKIRSTDESVKGRGASTGCSVGVSLGCGRGRPPSEAQVPGLRPAAQLLPRLRALRVAPHWRRPRPRRCGREPWPASRRRAGDRRARRARPSAFRGRAHP